MQELIELLVINEGKAPVIVGGNRIDGKSTQRLVFINKKWVKRDDSQLNTDQAYILQTQKPYNLRISADQD